MGRSRSRSPRRKRSRERKSKRSRSRSRSPKISRRTRNKSPSPTDRYTSGRSTRKERRRSRSRSRGDRHRSRSRSRSRSKSNDEKNEVQHVPITVITLDDNEPTTDGKTEEELEMMRLMGFEGFTTTKGKHVDGNNIGAVHQVVHRKYRQYMNRKGGFNRPLQNE